MAQKIIRISIGVVLGLLLIWGLYALVKRVLHDRDAALNFQGPPMPRPFATSGPSKTVQTYTKEDLEKARKEGKLPPEAHSQPIPVPPAGMDDTVQRNLRTLDEINRINQMNQRLMEQQERMRRQTKN